MDQVRFFIKQCDQVFMLQTVTQWFWIIHYQGEKVASPGIQRAKQTFIPSNHFYRVGSRKNPDTVCSKMFDKKMDINFARSSTGDGFYIWNRDLGNIANTHLYHFMHLALADNTIARRKAHGRTVPLLRACFHIGGCYEFYQANGLNPTMSNRATARFDTKLML